MLVRLRSGESPLVHIRRTALHAVITALSLVAASSGGIYAFQNTSAANAMLLFATARFLAAILEGIVLREGVRFAIWIAISLAVGGIAISVADKSGGGALKGSFAALGSAFGFGVFTVALRWGRRGEMLPAVFLLGLFAIVFTLAICLGSGLSVILSPIDSGTAIAIGMGLFQVGAGSILYTLGSRSFPAAELSLLSLAKVLLDPLWVWLFLGETAIVNTEWRRGSTRSYRGQCAVRQATKTTANHLTLA